MRLVPAAVSAAFFLCACATAPEPAPKRQADAPASEETTGKEDTPQPTLAEGDFVLIYTDAEFYETLDAPERVHRAFTWSRQRASRPFQPVVYARVVEDRGEHVVVRSISQNDPKVCDARALLPSRGIEVHFIVERDDLAPTLTRPIAFQHDDGTGFELQPGVPLEPLAGSNGTYRTWNEDIAFEVRLTDSDVGDGFSDYQELDVRYEAKMTAPPVAGWHLGGEQISFSEDVERSDKLEATEFRRDGRHIFLTLDRPCARVTATVARASEVEEAEDDSVGYGTIGAVIGGLESHYEVPAGTPIFWPEGERAGVTNEAVKFGLDTVGDQQVVCHSERMLVGIHGPSAAPDEQVYVQYCFNRADMTLVEEEKAKK